MSAKKSKPAAAGEEPSFEEALEQLETIVDELESGDLSLDQSIARFEQGTKLSRLLTRKLEEAEKRIERLIETRGEEEPSTEPMTLETERDEPAQRPKRSSTSEELPF